MPTIFQRISLVLVCAGLGLCRGVALENGAPLRVIVETDAGGDPDDEQSLVRFLLYANEWEIEGILANRATARDGENHNPERSGLGIVRRLVRAYGACYSNLAQHDRRYPAPDILLERTVAGYEDVDDGVNLVMSAVDRNDPRPVWFLNWGTDHGSASSCLKRALDRVLRDRGEGGYRQFKSRLRLSSDNQFEPHTSKMAPAFSLWIDTFRPPMGGKRWYHRFSAITGTAGGFDLSRDVLNGHGPLGALYPTNTTHWQKEGDSMTFLYLVPTGMNDPDQPGWGSWAGRYGPNETYAKRPYYWANQLDAWGGSTNRDNTLRRWAADLQNDFRARLDWCVKSYREANHPPVAVVNGEGGKEIIRLKRAANTTLHFSAAGSSDPDQNGLAYQWFVYPEAGTASFSWAGSNEPTAAMAIPREAVGRQIHLILRVTDNGQPPLSACRRIVVEVEPARGENR